MTVYKGRYKIRTIFELGRWLKNCQQARCWQLRFYLTGFHYVDFIILIHWLTRFKKYFSRKWRNCRQEERSILGFLRRLNWLVAYLNYIVIEWQPLRLWQYTPVINKTMPDWKKIWPFFPSNELKLYAIIAKRVTLNRKDFKDLKGKLIDKADRTDHYANLNLS